MHKRLLTIDDLAMFCEMQKFMKFDSQEYGYHLTVQAPALFMKQEDKDPYSLYAKCLVMHTSTNRNHSNLTEKGAKKAMETIPYKPVLANFCEIDGVRDFTSHDYAIDENGNYIYLERQIGCFTSKKPYLEQDPDNPDRKNIWAEIVIPREYTDAADIIERKGGTKVSVELDILQFEYDIEKKELVFNDVAVRGLTCLGVDPDTGEEIQEGMLGASIKLEDFSSKNNSLFDKTVNEITEAVILQLSNRLAEKATYNEGKEDEKAMNHLDEKFDEDNKNIDDFDGEGTPINEDMDETSTDESTSEEEGTGSEDNTESATDNENEDDDSSVDDDVLPAKKKDYSFNAEEFESSMSEIQNAIWTLVNETYAEADNDYYMCEVYQDSKSIVMIGVYSGKCYRQSYKVRKDAYSLVGDRVSVKAVYVTADEEAELDKMRNNYSLISDKLGKYEAEPEKMEILNSKEYLNIADTAAFNELRNVEKHFDMSIEDLKNTCDKLLLDYAKGNKIEFSNSQEEAPKKYVGLKLFANSPNKGNKRYGNLFDN